MNSFPFEYFQKEVEGMSSQALQDTFTASATETNFQVISRTSNSATAVHEEPISLRSVLACIIPLPAASEITSVKLEILRCKPTTLVVVRSLSGNQESCRNLINDFKLRLQTLNMPNFFFYGKSLQSESNVYVEPLRQAALKAEPFQQIPLERILSSSEYGYIKDIENIMTAAQSNLSNSVFKMIDSESDKISKKIVNNFSYFSFVYCKSVLEKKIYSKLYPALMRYYKTLTEYTDHLFTQKKMKALSFPSSDLLKTLQVSSKFLLSGVTEPYEDAKVVLRRFSKLKTPLDKVNCLIAAVACMKACVVEYWKGGLEIQAPDDELPVIMFLLLTCDIEYPFAELAILENYVAGRLENESRIILNFNSALSYLSMCFG